MHLCVRGADKVSLSGTGCLFCVWSFKPFLGQFKRDIQAYYLSDIFNSFLTYLPCLQTGEQQSLYFFSLMVERKISLLKCDCN